MADILDLSAFRRARQIDRAAALRRRRTDEALDLVLEEAGRLGLLDDIGGCIPAAPPRHGGFTLVCDDINRTED